MFLVSNLLDLFSWLAGPRVAHDIYLKRLERRRTFEQEYYLLDHFVDPNRASIDVGANLGVYSGRLSQLSKTVHAVEPNPDLARELRTKLRNNVIVHQCAASDFDGVAELRIPYKGLSEEHGTATMEIENELPGSTGEKRVSVPVVKLDNLVTEPVGFMKVDVEGHEYAALNGAQKILRESRPIVLVESEKRHNSTEPERIFTLMEQNGYEGIYLRKKWPVSLRNFDPSLDQNPKNIGRQYEGVGTSYFNNFIFFPRVR